MLSLDSIKATITLGTYLAFSLATEPTHLKEKITRKLRLAVAQRRSPIYRFLAQKKLFACPRHCFSSTKQDRHYCPSKFQIKLLKSAIEPSVRSNDSGNIKPLFILTNSEPYTQSGYTERTKMLLGALASELGPVDALTRYGYPATIGKLSSEQPITIAGVNYYKNLGWRFPFSSEKFVEHSVRGVVRQAEMSEATLLHTTTPSINAVVVSRAAAILKIPWVYEIRGETENTWLSQFAPREHSRAVGSEFYRRSKQQETEAARQAAGVVVLSEVSRGRFIERGIDPNKITVMPNMIDSSVTQTACSQQSARNTLNLSSETLVGSITSVVDYEGLDTLILALEHLPDEVTAVIVGDGKARPALERLAAEHGVEDRVIFAGKRSHEEALLWYRALDVFVLPRKDEKVCRTVTPIKAANAQALGIPVVASNLPALLEVTGGLEFYVEPSQPALLAAKIIEALESQQERILNAPERSNWVSQRSWNSNAIKLINLYRKIV